MTAFVIQAGTYLLFYKHNGAAWTTPLSSSTHVEKPAQIGGWEPDWALVVPFNN